MCNWVLVLSAMSAGVGCGGSSRVVRPITPTQYELDAQKLHRRAELYAGGLSRDWQLGLQQLERYEDTRALWEAVQARYGDEPASGPMGAAVREVAAVMRQFRHDLESLVPFCEQMLIDALQRAASAARSDDAILREQSAGQALLLVRILEVALGEMEPMARQAREAYQALHLPTQHPEPQELHTSGTGAMEAQ